MNGGWDLRPGETVTQIVYRWPDGRVRVMATRSTPGEAMRTRRKLERRYPEGPPAETPAKKS